MLLSRDVISLDDSNRSDSIGEAIGEGDFWEFVIPPTSAPPSLSDASRVATAEEGGDESDDVPGVSTESSANGEDMEGIVVGSDGGSDESQLLFAAASLLLREEDTEEESEEEGSGTLLSTSHPHHIGEVVIPARLTTAATSTVAGTTTASSLSDAESAMEFAVEDEAATKESQTDLSSAGANGDSSPPKDAVAEEATAAASKIETSDGRDSGSIVFVPLGLQRRGGGNRPTEATDLCHMKTVEHALRNERPDVVEVPNAKSDNEEPSRDDDEVPNTKSDEELARELQSQFDAEAATAASVSWVEVDGNGEFETPFLPFQRALRNLGRNVEDSLREFDDEHHVRRKARNSVKTVRKSFQNVWTDARTELRSSTRDFRRSADGATRDVREAARETALRVRCAASDVADAARDIEEEHHVAEKAAAVAALGGAAFLAFGNPRAGAAAFAAAGASLAARETMRTQWDDLDGSGRGSMRDGEDYGLKEGVHID